VNVDAAPLGVLAPQVALEPSIGFPSAGLRDAERFEESVGLTREDRHAQIMRVGREDDQIDFGGAQRLSLPVVKALWPDNLLDPAHDAKAVMRVVTSIVGKVLGGAGQDRRDRRKEGFGTSGVGAVQLREALE
jgi:hypothetical protein